MRVWVCGCEGMGVRVRGWVCGCKGMGVRVWVRV